MSKRKEKTNRKLELLKRCNKSCNLIKKAIKTGDPDKIAKARDEHRANCSKLQIKN